MRQCLKDPCFETAQLLLHPISPEHGATVRHQRSIRICEYCQEDSRAVRAARRRKKEWDSPYLLLLRRLQRFFSREYHTGQFYQFNVSLAGELLEPAKGILFVKP